MTDRYKLEDWLTGCYSEETLKYKRDYQVSILDKEEQSKAQKCIVDSQLIESGLEKNCEKKRLNTFLDRDKFEAEFLDPLINALSTSDDMYYMEASTANKRTLGINRSQKCGLIIEKMKISF